MRVARSLKALTAALTALLLAGCAHLPFFSGDKAGEAASAKAASPAALAASAAAPSARADYRLEVQAPDPLRALLLNYLDLARFQNAPATEGINAAELERLMRATPAQARGLLETEGYFNARVTVQRSDDQTADPPTDPNAARSASPGGGASDLPLLRVVVDPGPRATVASTALEVTGDLQTAASAGDAAATAEIAALRAQWPLPRDAVFRQGAWADAKNATLARLRADGYAAASWGRTAARVDAADNRVTVDASIVSGPLYRLGALRIEGLKRYDETTVRRLSTFSPGDPYSEKTLLDFQERLQKLGLFEGASVALDTEADGQNPQATPVVVRVKEQPLQQATVGLGYSANTGPRVSLEHTQRSLFGSRWIAHNKFEFGPDQKLWEGELTSHPLDGLYRNLISGSASKLLVDDQQILSWNARVGRGQDTPRIDRTYFAELAHARVDSAQLTSQADAVSGNYHWVFRDLDNLLLPTRGVTLSAQGALGVARGNRSVLDQPLETAQGPFARLYGRLTWYKPLGDSWYGTARVEGGQVFARNAVGIPDTLLFRAGGDDSVRGYGYRTLGPSISGVTISGRTLLTGSLEVARPISPKYPAYWWAAFVDAGNAADRWSDLKPALGYGLGLRWRSPVGPLRVDVAYGQEVKSVRVHLSVGVTF